MYEIYDFNIVEINEVLTYLEIEPLSLSGTFETMLFTRLDTIITLLSIQNSNINMMIDISTNELLQHINILQQSLVAQQYTTIISTSILFALLGIVIAFMVFILIGVLWKK